MYYGYDWDEDDFNTKKTIRVDRQWHRHIIGKGGCNIKQIRADTNTTIDIPPLHSDSDIITINGRSHQIRQAEREIMKIVDRYADADKSRVIMIDHKYHGKIIGHKGEKMREIRQRFPTVHIDIPESGVQSNKINLKGPKVDVDRCYVYMEQLKDEFAKSNFELEVTVPKRFHGCIIGRGGSTINNIKSETNTAIEVPGKNSNSEVVRITGSKRDAKRAQTMIQSVIEDQKDEVPRKPLHSKSSKVYEASSNLPSHWPKACTIGQRIPVKGTNFNTLKQNFIRSVEIEVEVTEINEICNVEFYEKYQGKKKNMQSQLGGGSIGERQLYHGTEHRIVQPICVQNFDFRLCGKNAVVYGKGSYFARDASYSHRYTTADSSSTRYMFVADVLVGKYTKGSTKMVRPPPLPQNNHQLYDSCVDNVTNPSIFVIFERDQCYPRYLISYKVKTPAYRPPVPRSSTVASYGKSRNLSHTTYTTPTYPSYASTYKSPTNAASSTSSYTGSIGYNASTYKPSTTAPVSTRSSAYGTSGYTTSSYQPSSNVPTSTRSSVYHSPTYNTPTTLRQPSISSYTSSHQQRSKKSMCPCVLM